MTYLIAHVVRGAPAFDCADRMECPECAGYGCPECDAKGYWWIIGTSGHRAFPYASWNIEDLIDASDYPHDKPWTHDVAPANWPDHYRTKSTPKPPTDILKALGLVKPKEPIRRRI